jgi:hypothetical protein
MSKTNKEARRVGIPRDRARALVVALLQQVLRFIRVGVALACDSQLLLVS